jgi:predicted acetyltransferase
MVGFAMLFPLAEDVPRYPVPADATLRGYVLVRLMIDARFQGRGYGRDALAAIVETVRGRGLATIRLAVVPHNEQALEFYRRNGFTETGEIQDGEIVMEGSSSRAYRSPRTSYAATGRPKPLSSSSPAGAVSTASSTAAKTRWPIRICPAPARVLSRDARFATGPTAP